MKKEVFPLILMLLLVVTFVNTDLAKAYSDTGNHWAEDYIGNLSDRELIDGYEDGTFKPNNTITKAEFYKLINNLAGFDKTYTVSFSDVKKTDWFHEDVAKGIKVGYITPTTGLLNPNAPITREDALWIIGYIYKLPEKPEVVEKFADYDSFRENTRGFVGTLVDLEIIDGYPDDYFYPEGSITRAEISKVLTLCTEKLGNPKNEYLMDSEIKFGPRDLYE